MQIISQSHLDHGLTDEQIKHITERFADRDAFFIESFDLPESLGSVPCALYGPAMGDEPVPESEVTYAKRGDREIDSRMVARPMRPTRTLTVIAGPHKDEETGQDFPCVLYTAFGGPLAEKEPGDPTLTDDDAKARAAAFWKDHALAE